MPIKYVLTKTTYLEMRRPPHRALEVLSANIQIEQVYKPSVDFYRFLYNSVGRDFHWVDRNLLADEPLEHIIHDELVEIYLVKVDGEAAGYAELDRRAPGEIELAYFGLFPPFIGRGLGKYFLAWTLQQAWSYQPQRVWVHTCDLDHRAALPNYLKAGFSIYDEKLIEQRITSD